MDGEFLFSAFSLHDQKPETSNSAISSFILDHAAIFEPPGTALSRKNNSLTLQYYHLLLSDLGFATETDMALPPTSLLFKPAIAFLASSSESISTKPKPRLRPVSRSLITLADDTEPN